MKISENTDIYINANEKFSFHSYCCGYWSMGLLGVVKH